MIRTDCKMSAGLVGAVDELGKNERLLGIQFGEFSESSSDIANFHVIGSPPSAHVLSFGFEASSFVIEADSEEGKQYPARDSSGLERLIVLVGLRRNSIDAVVKQPSSIWDMPGEHSLNIFRVEPSKSERSL